MIYDSGIWQTWPPTLRPKNKEKEGYKKQRPGKRERSARPIAGPSAYNQWGVGASWLVGGRKGQLQILPILESTEKCKANSESGGFVLQQVQLHFKVLVTKSRHAKEGISQDNVQGTRRLKGQNSKKALLIERCCRSERIPKLYDFIEISIHN